MDYLLLERIGFFVKVLVNGGYFLAGGYFLKTGYRYVTDYKMSVANENKEIN